MKVLLVGSGAREHALAWKLKRSELVEDLSFWPGGPAMKNLGETLSYTGSSWKDLANEAKRQNFDFVVVGPEQPLAEGLADDCGALGIPVFGPKQAAAQLESSKSFAKKVMADAGIPTAAYKVTHSFEECRRVAKEMLTNTGGAVIKASGLAAGKGVFVCTEESQVDAGLDRLETSMAAAAETIVVEEILKGRECSFFCMVGGDEATPLGFAVDFKRLKNGDEGPNTGGMGCYTPVPWLPENASDLVMAEVVKPLLKQLKAMDIKYQGYLYVGLMWGEKGPEVVEFNARLGDPEAQVLAVQDPRDWGVLIADQLGVKPCDPSCYEADLSSKKSLAVVMAGEGYPYEKPTQKVEPLPTKLFLNEATSRATFGAAVTEQDGVPFPGGGRVLTVVYQDQTFTAAKEKVYEAVTSIAATWPQAQYRTDIGSKVLD